MEPGVCGPIKHRIAAKCVDALILTWIAFSLGSLSATLELGPGIDDPALTSPTTAALLLTAYAFLWWPVCLAAYTSMFHGVWGATPGKLLFELEVVGEDGTALTGSQAVKRGVFELVCFLPLALGYLSAAGNPRRQTWYDRWCRTLVVSAPGRFVTFLGRRLHGRPAALATAGLLMGAGIALSSFAPRFALWTEGLGSRHDRFIRVALSAQATGDFRAALEACNRALEADPRSSLAYANRGAVQGDLGNYQLQIADCTKALELDSTQVFAYLNRGHGHRELGQYREALSDYSSVIRLRPEWSGLVYAYLGRGAVLFRMGNFAAAAADFEAGTRAGMEHYLGQSDFAKGKDFVMAIDTCRLCRGEALRRSGDVVAAERVLNEAPIRSLSPEDLRERAQRLRYWLGVEDADSLVAHS